MAKKEPDQLAQDAAAALAAGMSYGKWKAMQENPVVVKKKEPELPEGWKYCKFCHKPFKPKSNRTQFYCEPHCQVAAQRGRDKEKRSEYWRNYMAKKRAERKEVNESYT